MQLKSLALVIFTLHKSVVEGEKKKSTLHPQSCFPFYIPPSILIRKVTNANDTLQEFSPAKRQPNPLPPPFFDRMVRRRGWGGWNSCVVGRSNTCLR
ncbi:hypothetical protein CDAR_60101 [Caerostris darwini]|uniref:Secreted protein n=1 Tax=Caerostris darwini TaxID=1538125 RepID=A0AAV4QK90_9ARAC|nr:hypothetical protein CDAR_60101 [Caerostris darwini]